VFSTNGAYSSQLAAASLLRPKINSAESAIHAWCLGLTSAVIDSRLQRLFLETDFPGALPQAENEERAPLALSRYAR